jgi:hypothetical protein
MNGPFRAGDVVGSLLPRASPWADRIDLSGRSPGLTESTFQALLAPEVRKAFPTDEEVNQALLSLIQKKSA